MLIELRLETVLVSLFNKLLVQLAGKFKVAGKVAGGYFSVIFRFAVLWSDHIPSYVVYQTSATSY